MGLLAAVLVGVSSIFLGGPQRPYPHRVWIRLLQPPFPSAGRALAQQDPTQLLIKWRAQHVYLSYRIQTLDPAIGDFIAQFTLERWVSQIEDHCF